MSIEERHYVDLEALRVFKTKMDKTIEDGDNSVKNYVDDIFTNTQVVKPVYYALDATGDRIPIYEEAEGEAESGVVYYTRTGTGSNTHPYVYEVADPQPTPGSILDPGMYYQTEEFETTLENTGDPVLDDTTGEQITVVATILDGAGEITEADIMDLFDEED